MSSYPVVSVGDVTSILMGQSPPGSTYNDVQEGLPFFQGKAQFGALQPIADKWCSAPIRIAEPGDILLSVRAPVGPTNRASTRCCIGRGLAALRTADQRLDQNYLHWFMRWSEPKLAAKGSGSTFQAVGRKEIASLTIPLPPLEEQRRIVGLLDRAAEIRRRADAARTHARAIIPALFTDMFGDPATNPKGWPSQPLGLVIDRIVGGKNLEAGNGSNYHRILKVSAVTSGYFRPEEAKPAPDEHQPIPDHRVRNGDFLFSRANTSALVGAVAIVDGEYKGLLLPDKIWRIEWQVDAVEPRFMYSLMRSSHIRRVFARLASGTSDSMKNISQAKLRSIEIPLPPLPLQTAFAEQARRIEATARTLDAAAAKAEALAAALSAEVFDMPAAASPATGRVAEPAPA